MVIENANSRKINNNKGFTLVELIVVLVILAILAAILVPALLGYIDRSKAANCAINKNSLVKAAISLYVMAYGKSKTVTDDASFDKYLSTRINTLYEDAKPTSGTLQFENVCNQLIKDKVNKNNINYQKYKAQILTEERKFDEALSIINNIILKDCSLVNTCPQMPSEMDSQGHGALVGYAVNNETAPGVWVDEIIERQYYGDLVRDTTSKWSAGDSINDNLTFSNAISVVADPYMYEHYHEIKYVEFEGGIWKVASVEKKRPRLILTLGGIWNGEQA